MIEVSRETFYQVIGPQKVNPYPEGKYPYTSFFKTPSGIVRGKAVDYFPEESALPETRYYLPDGEASS